jgi:hypothetical protein
VCANLKYILVNRTQRSSYFYYVRSPHLCLRFDILSAIWSSIPSIPGVKVQFSQYQLPFNSL